MGESTPPQHRPTSAGDSATRDSAATGAAIAEALKSRLDDPSIVVVEPSELSARARDWWPLARLREVRGDGQTVPAVLVLPTSTDQVSAVLRWASETGTPVVPRGLGSGVCGAVEPVANGILLDMSHMGRVLDLDEVSQVVSVEAGIRGDVLEEYLNARSLTVGHYPQSIKLSTVGGWIALSGAGQASPAFGAIEDHVAGLTVVLSDGTVVRLKPVSRTASGPDLRRLFVGSEGTFGVVTEAALSCAPLAAGTSWQAFRYETFEQVLDAAREILRSGAGPSFSRGWDADDSATAFRKLGLESGCVGLVGLDVSAPGLLGRQAVVAEVATRHGGLPLEERYGEHWWQHRLDAVDVFDAVMGPARIQGSGAVLDTFEPSGLWRDIPAIYHAVDDALRTHAAEVRCHFSHVYPAGAALYFTFTIHGADDYAAEATYTKCWAAAMEACIGAGGSIAHHHGIGRLKSGLLQKELGAGALETLRRIKAAVDPAGVLNPGTLFPPREGVIGKQPIESARKGGRRGVAG